MLNRSVKIRIVDIYIDIYMDGRYIDTWYLSLYPSSSLSAYIYMYLYIDTDNVYINASR